LTSSYVSCSEDKYSAHEQNLMCRRSTGNTCSPKNHQAETKMKTR